VGGEIEKKSARNIREGSALGQKEGLMFGNQLALFNSHKQQINQHTFYH
jgi:hypothetical protein